MAAVFGFSIHREHGVEQARVREPFGKGFQRRGSGFGDLEPVQIDVGAVGRHDSLQVHPVMIAEQNIGARPLPHQRREFVRMPEAERVGDLVPHHRREPVAEDTVRVLIQGGIDDRPRTAAEPGDAGVRSERRVERPQVGLADHQTAGRRLDELVPRDVCHDLKDPADDPPFLLGDLVREPANRTGKSVRDTADRGRHRRGRPGGPDMDLFLNVTMTGLIRAARVGRQRDRLGRDPTRDPPRRGTQRSQLGRRLERGIVVVDGDRIPSHRRAEREPADAAPQAAHFDVVRPG